MTDRKGSTLPAHPESDGHWDHSQISALLHERDRLRAELAKAKREAQTLRNVAVSADERAEKAEAELAALKAQPTAPADDVSDEEFARQIERMDEQGKAQPAAQAEPVWIQPDHLAKARRAPFLCRVEPAQRDDFVPLYAHPAQPADAHPMLEPTHICKDCGVPWRMCDDFSFNLRGPKACPACDNTPVGGQLIPITAPLTREIDRLRAEVEALQQQLGECSGGYQTLEREVEALRNTLDFIAEFQSSNWPERCQENVRRARVARSCGLQRRSGRG